MTRARISACLIVRDEEQQLPACLASVAFCDEIVVVDSGSSDRTVELATAAGAKVIEPGWRGFAAQRNVALDHASGDWVLEIDADERVSSRLRDEIEQLLSHPPAEIDNACIPLRNWFLGRYLGPAALYPHCRMRLLRRGSYRHDESRTVHEGLWPQGRSAYLDGDLEHRLASSLREALADTVAYSRLEAQQLPPTPRWRAVALGVLLRPATKFAYRVWLQGGWRDGYPGVAKIALECLSDALVWGRYLVSGPDAGRAPEEARSTGHFGQRGRYGGPARVAALGRGEQDTAAAADWLLRAAAEGADVVLITDASTQAPDQLRTVRLPRLGPLLTMRALEAESQRNPIERLVCTAELRRLAALVPPHLRGRAPPVSTEEEPGSVVAATVAARARSDALTPAAAMG